MIVLIIKQRTLGCSNYESKSRPRPDTLDQRLMKRCLDKDLKARFLDFKEIEKALSTVTRLKKSVIEIILDTLESYSQDLEKQVRNG